MEVSSQKKVNYLDIGLYGLFSIPIFGVGISKRDIAEIRSNSTKS